MNQQADNAGNKPIETVAKFPEKMRFLFEPSRYKVAYGGRYGVKSWSFARALLLIAVQPSLLWPGRVAPPRILCARETQKSIEESVHRTLADQIENLGLERFYEIQQTSIFTKGGAEFAFAGIRQHVNNVKSFEGFDIVWVEEAATVSKNSWNVLIPTIRKEGSEIWLSFNPELETDETYQRFVVSPPKLSKVVFTTYRDNPWVTEVMRQDMEDLRVRNEQDYLHVYEGQCKSTVEGAIYVKEIATAEREGRFTEVPYDPTVPVSTFWDLGVADNTSIWFVQNFPFQVRVIDHLSGSGQGLGYYVKQLQERPYAYASHFLPHDGAARELGSGTSIQEQLGKTFGLERVKVTKRLAIADGIAAVRALFGKCWFDKERCADGIQSLRHYRYAVDEKLDTLKREPLHDWASHDADAFKTLAISVEALKPPKKATPSQAPRAMGAVWG